MNSPSYLLPCGRLPAGSGCYNSNVGGTGGGAISNGAGSVQNLRSICGPGCTKNHRIQQQPTIAGENGCVKPPRHQQIINDVCSGGGGGRAKNMRDGMIDKRSGVMYDESTASHTPTTGTPSASPTVSMSPFTSYRGPDCTPPLCDSRIYDSEGPACFDIPPFEGGTHPRAELRPWEPDKDVIISQNSSKRKVHRGIWLSPLYLARSFPVAVKFVEDQNQRDGRSVKREIECHIYIYHRLQLIQRDEGYERVEDAWPAAELLGYHLDRRNPGRCVLITRKLSGPDFFDVIRQEHSGSVRVDINTEFRKLTWCALALRRVQQYARLGIRHNDIKPDNIVLDYYEGGNGQRNLDVKIIDLGTASMHSAKEFTGGTSWYESPEQKVLEYYSKKLRNLEKAKQVDIGLTSDIWAAGLSVTEVLVGKRVVDCLKLPMGPGPLDYRGQEESWVVDPITWIGLARKALLTPTAKEPSRNSYCLEAGRLIFDHLVVPNSAARGTLADALEHLEVQKQNILDKYRGLPWER